MQLCYTLQQRCPYDVHVYYNIPDQLEEAMTFRDKMRKAFPWMRFYTPKDAPLGPHPIPMFEADFRNYDNRFKLESVCHFLREEHGSLSVLVHPHSTEGAYVDHTRHAMWFGKSLPLRIQSWKKQELE